MNRLCVLISQLVLVGCCFTITVFMPAPVLGKDTGTFVSVQGNVWVSAEDQSWNPAVVGQKIFFGNTLKTEAGATTGILNPDGTLIRISENTKLIYKPGIRPKKKAGFFRILKDLFSKQEQTRIGGARGIKEGKVKCPENSQIGLVLDKDIFTGKDLERIFLMASRFEQCGKAGIAAGLIVHLSMFEQDNEGFQHLAQSVVVKAKRDHDFTLKAKWNVFVKSAQKRQFIAKRNNEITTGTQFRVHYHAEKDSYLYLFLTDPQNKITKVIHPEDLQAGIGQPVGSHRSDAIKGGRAGQIIPKKGWSDFGKSNSDRILWGWACMAPLSDRSVQHYTGRVQESLTNTISDSGVTENIPELCLDSFFQSYITAK